MGKSSSQVVGYRYYANFLAFIGNRIEDLLAINFDKRGWETGRQVPMGENGKMLYIHLPNIYGENEGGVSGALCLKYGSDTQSPDPAYKKYTDSFGSFAPAYPFQSYISFSGFELASRFSQLSEAELQVLADQYNDGIIPGRGFYLGNSGYMKEMLLWVKRIHVKNNGGEQWYDAKAEIGLARFEDKTVELTSDYLSTAGDFFTKYETNRRFSSSGQIRTNSNPPSRVLGGSFGYQGGEVYGGNADAGWPIKSDGETIATYSPNYSGGFSFKIEVLSVGKTEFRKLGLGDSFFNIVDSWDIPEAGYGYYTNGYLLECFVYPNESLVIKFNTKFPSDESWSKSRHAIQILPIQPKLGIIHKGSASGTDINPIHKIREILTDDTAMAKPEADVNDQNFVKAADQIWKEGLGISWAIDEKSCIDAIEELCYHVEAGIRVNRQTGLYEMVLFRDDWFAEDEIHAITENKIKDLSLEVMNSDDIVNQLNVTYYDRERIKDSTFSVYENGSILTMGHANAESIDFPYFMNMRNAEIVANWKLKQYSTPAWKGTFTTGWREARKWNRYDLIRLPWSKKWNGTILVRIMKINLGNGTDNTVTIDFEEVIPYSGEMNTSIVVDTPVETAPQPPQPSVNAVFEAPYYLTVLRAGQTNTDLELSNNPDIGYVVAVAAKPQNNSLNALLYTDGGMGEFEQVSRLDYCDILQLDQSIIETTSSFTVAGSLTQAANSNNLILLNDELMGFVSFDNETKVLTVKRGVLDTVPKKHSGGSLFVFDLPDVAFDSTQYSQSEIVEAQVLTTTPSGIQDLLGYGQDIEIQSRAIRPYPPANVKINGEYWPAEIETNLVITWVDRNRVQQTGGGILGWFEGGVTIEPNTQTHLILTQLDENDLELATTNANLTGTTSYTFPISSMQTDARKVRVILKTLRDSYECLNPFIHTVELSQFFSAPYDLTVEFKND